MARAARAVLAVAVLLGAFGCAPAEVASPSPPPVAAAAGPPEVVVPPPAPAGEPPPGGVPVPAAPAKYEDPCMDALDWLARHQSPDGSWDADGFPRLCRGEPCTGAATRDADVGVTGLALLAFVACGETHKTPRYGPVVRAGLKHLRAIQDAEGSFGPRTDPRFVEDHALAACAMVEAYGMTQSPLFKVPAQKAVEFAEHCRNPGGAWGRGIRPGTNDLEVTVWMVMALRSAQIDDLEVEPAVFTEVKAWLDTITDPVTGRVGPAGPLETATAMAVTARGMCRRATGAADPLIERGIEICGRRVPAWDERPGGSDLRYWYFGTGCCYIHAVVRFGRLPSAIDRSDRWAQGLCATLHPRYRGKDAGCARESFDPCDPWTVEHGRVASTALAVMTDSCFY